MEQRMRALGKSVEFLSTFVLAIELCLVLAGVISRYLFNNPLLWGDEIASGLFLWLTMLGAVVALDHGQHLGLTFAVKRAPEWLRPYMGTAAWVATLLFLVLLIKPSYEYAEEEMESISAVLGVTNVWRASAIFAGVVLMFMVCLCKLYTHFVSWRVLATATASVVGAGIILKLATPLLLAIGSYNLLIFFVIIVLAAMLIGVPIAFVFGLATFSYIDICTHSPTSLIVNRMDGGMSNMILLSIPLFIFLGLMIEMAGLARVMVNFLASLVGHLRGGLSYVLLGGMYLVSGISGSKTADMAAIAPVLFPEMKKRGADPAELTSLLAASSAMSETIPPSLVLITIGTVTGVSIASLFIGGLVPALVLALALAVVAYFRSRKSDDLSKVHRANLPAILRSLLVALPALILPFVIRTAVVEGVATATEVSTIGIVYTFVVGVFVYRTFQWNSLGPMLVETASMSAAVLLIIGTASGMAWSLTQSGFARTLNDLMTGLPGGAVTFMALSVVAFIVFGSVLEGIPAIVLFGPLLFPIAKTVGINEVHYAIVAVLAMGLGLYMPPFGVGYYSACAIGRVDPNDPLKRIWPYLGAVLIGIVIVAAIPWLSTGFLPER
jgi:tripartite ATP-independent transporter DctM subunit